MQFQIERLNGHQKFAGSFTVWGSEIVFLSIKLDERSSISWFIQAHTFPKSEINFIVYHFIKIIDIKTKF